jgi:hypothetical protein
MSRTAALLGGLLVFAAAPITAQAVVQPEKPLDPAQAEVRDAMVMLRDSLNTLTAAGARFVRGVGPTSSVAWLQARARSLATACTRSRTTMVVVRPAVENGNGTTKAQHNARGNLLASMAALDDSLMACEKTWKARSSRVDATPIREQGPSEVESLNHQAQAFDRRLVAYATTLGFKLPPLGSGTPAETR